MRDNRGVNRMVEVLNSGIETGNSSNLIPKSSLSVDAASTVLKERNTNDATGDSTKAHDTIAKETKANDVRQCKLNAQCASDSNVQRTLNDQSFLDVDDYDEDDDDVDDDEDEDDYEKCAKISENDTLMDVDEPADSLYVNADLKSKNDNAENYGGKLKCLVSFGTILSLDNTITR